MHPSLTLFNDNVTSPFQAFNSRVTFAFPGRTTRESDGDYCPKTGRSEEVIIQTTIPTNAISTSAVTMPITTGDVGFAGIISFLLLVLRENTGKIGSLLERILRRGFRHRRYCSSGPESQA